MLFVYPFVYGLGLSFQPKTGGLFGAYVKFFTDPVRGLDSIWVTLQLAVPAALLNVLVSCRSRTRCAGSSAASGP